MFGPIAAVSDQPLAQRPGPSRNGAPQLVGAATRAILGHRASSRMRYAWMVMCRKLTPMGGRPLWTAPPDERATGAVNRTKLTPRSPALPDERTTGAAQQDASHLRCKNR